MKQAFREAGLLVASCLLPFAGIAQSQRTKIDVATLGPQVGQQVPDFSLNDQNGKNLDPPVHPGAERRNVGLLSLRGLVTVL